MNFNPKELAQAFVSFIETKCSIIADKVKWDDKEEAVVLTVTKNDNFETKFYINEGVTAVVECVFVPLNIAGAILSFPADTKNTYRIMNERNFKPDTFIFTRALELFLNEVNEAYVKHLSSKPENEPSPETQLMNALINHLILNNVKPESIKHIGAGCYRVELNEAGKSVILSVNTTIRPGKNVKRQTHLCVSYIYDEFKPVTLYAVSLLFGNWVYERGDHQYINQIPEEIRNLINSFVTDNFKHNAKLFGFEDWV